MSVKLAIVLWAVIFVTLWLLVFRDMRHDWRNHRRLARSGVQLVGTVTAKEPMNHQSVRFDYAVGSTHYAGGPCGITQTSEFERIRIGDPIQITYLREQPMISVCGDAKGTYSTASGVLFAIVPVWAGLGALGLALYIYGYFNRKATVFI